MEEKGTVRTAAYIAPKRGFFERARTQKELIFLSLPFIVFFFIFSYYPLWGLTMAFQNFKPGIPFWEQEWVGFDQFVKLFSDPRFPRVMRNTISMSLINLTLNFISSIAFALFLNELANRYFKRFVQSISYMPHFLSWIIVCSLIGTLLSADGGIVNNALMSLKIIDQPISFLNDKDKVWGIVGLANVWKSMGWNSIIYLAAITGINPELYEAAAIDGCGRFKRMWHITLPGIKSTIIILLILNAGWILNAGFELQFILFGSGSMLQVSETIDIFVLDKGFGSGITGFSLGTAAGMFKTVVSVIILYICNKAAALAGEDRLI